MHTRKVHIAVFLAAIAGLLFFVVQNHFLSGETLAGYEDKKQEQKEEDSPIRYENVSIEDNDTFSIVMERANVSGTISANIYTASQNVYDLAKIRVGREIKLGYNKESGNLVSLIYQIDTEEELHVNLNESGEWQAEREAIQYEVKIKTAGGTINTSMYESALASGIDERAIIELANVFQWSVDFAMDVRQGDTFVFTYEERYRNGEYVMPGKVLAGKFSNDGHVFYAFNYTNSDGESAYYDEDANSVQKMFLKAPVEFRYISSGFTTGLRYVEAFNTSTGHRAIDYAAASGTPVRAVGDGVVTKASWNGPYGNFISIRHNGTYTTNYAHLSRYAVSYGQRVSQGQVIGYVGSTGFSTGPHLHYEMVKNGTKINPLLEVLPPGEAIASEEIEHFNSSIDPQKNILDNFSF